MGVTYDLSLLSATAGTATASKALILNASGGVDTISATTFKQAGTTYDLSLLSATAGTATASKAFILNASGAVDIISATTFKQADTTYDLSLLSATAGTATASRALILDTNKAADTLTVTGTFTSGTVNATTYQQGGTAVNFSNLSLLSATAGTATANKALILGSTKNVDSLSITGVGTVVTYGGTSWQSNANAIAANQWNGVAWSPDLGMYVAVGYTGTNRVMTSKDGSTWTARTAASLMYRAVVWSPELGVFVAAADAISTNQCIYSRDGVTWNTGICNSNVAWYSVIWCSDYGTFFACATDSSYGYLAYSSDGFTYTLVTVSGSSPVYGVNASYKPSICYSSSLKQLIVANNNLIYVGDMTLWKVITGTSMGWSSGWPSYTVGTGSVWTSVCWSSELAMYVAVGNAGTYRVATSTNGTTWTTQTVTAAASSTWKSVCWAAELGMFVAVADSGTNRIMTSTDGINWTGYATPASAWTSICWSPELRQLLGVSSDTANILTSAHNALSTMNIIKNDGSTVSGNTSGIGIQGDVALRYNGGFNGGHIWYNESASEKKELMRLNNQRLNVKTISG